MKFSEYTKQLLLHYNEVTKTLNLATGGTPLTLCYFQWERNDSLILSAKHELSTDQFRKSNGGNKKYSSYDGLEAYQVNIRRKVDRLGSVRAIRWQFASLPIQIINNPNVRGLKSVLKIIVH